MSESSFGGPAPAPVFVDQSGLRGRLLRGFGWPVSVVGAILAVAMGSSLIGVQADAPAMGIPAQRPPAPSRSPAPSLSPSPSSASSAARTATRSATPQAKSTATTTKPTATSTKAVSGTSKTTAGTSKSTTTAPRGAASSRQPTKHP
ncbi:hypothetical protein [Streptomyces sp. NPDC002209]|uniref:hypothetical protein n=1 Tax=Streptomyces sp. NPDC002209 TaxID=3364638 RepID=UPI00367DA4D8